MIEGAILLLASMFTIETPAQLPGQRSYAYHAAPLSCALAQLEPGTRYEAHVLMRGENRDSNAVELIVDGYPLTSRPGTGIIPRGFGRWAWADRYTSGEEAAFTSGRGRYTIVCIAHTEPGAEVAALLLIPQ